MSSKKDPYYYYLTRLRPIIALEKKKSAEVGYCNKTEMYNTHKYVHIHKVKHT